ncbi:MAG: TerD family protein [Ignavibacteria bacterium]
MALNLTKGSKLNFKKEDPGLRRVVIGLGWDANEQGIQFDLDASAFMLGQNNKTPSESFVVFYNNPKSPDNALMHMGDNRTGDGEGDDESIKIDLLLVDPSIVQIVFVVTIDQAVERNQNFGMVSNSFIRIYNEETSNVLSTYMLQESFPTADSVIMGRMFRNGDSWEFEAMGSGFDGGLQSLAEIYC